MYKKFLWTSVTVAFLWGANNAVGMDKDEQTPISRVPLAKRMELQDHAPGPEAWKDNAGHPAPASVRKAADNLWDAVKLEGAAAFAVNWGVQKKAPCGLGRALCCLCTCGFTECILSNVTFDEFTNAGMYNHPSANEHYTAKQREQEVTMALKEFREIVNSSVSKPEQYSGDAKICELGPWVEDDSLKVVPGFCCSCTDSTFVGGRRDLSLVPESTRAFVNAHGGWTDVKETVVVILEKK
jgi:hypothetical protein